MILRGVTHDHRTGRWTAIWRTPAGNTIHDTYRHVRLADEPAAWIYALDHYPEWSTS